MAVILRKPTEEELEGSIPVEVDETPSVRRATDDEIKGSTPVISAARSGPTGLPLPEQQETPGIVKRVIQRAMGTDIEEDPLELERLGTIIMGGLAGMQAGLRVPPVNPLINPITGAAAGGLTGVVAGAVAPEATLEGLEFLGILPEGAREETGLSDEELRRIASGEALLEIATGGTAGAIRITGRTTGRLATGIGKAEEDIAEAAAEQGVKLAPFQLGKRQLGKGIVNVLGRFPIIGSRARDVGIASEEALKKMKDELPSRLVPLMSTAKLGTKIFDQSRTLVKTVGAKFEDRYGELFLEANRLKVSYNPENTRQVANEILLELKKRRPAKKKVAEVPTDFIGKETAKVETKESIEAAKATEGMINFIEENVLNLTDQSLAQMDELLLKIDQQVGTAEKGTKAAFARLMAPLKAGVKSDILKNGIGEGAQEIGERLATIDADYAETMNFLFETATGNKFGSVRKTGLRGTVAPSKEATRMTVDKLANIVIDIDSPQAMEELSRLISPKTFQEIGGRVLANIFEDSMRELANGAIKLDADKLAKNLGKIGADTTRADALGFLFKKTGMDEKAIDSLVEAAISIADTPIPNWSTFIARRAGIGGAKGVVRGMVPFLALAGSGGAAGGGAGALLGGLLFLGGSKLLVDVVSNPVSARAFGKVISEEASMVVKRAAFLRIARAGIANLTTLGEFSAEVGKQLIEDAEEVGNQLFPSEKQTSRDLPADLQQTVSNL